jgi:pimeloyl-ACP methyl ester carboxylesterase
VSGGSAYFDAPGTDVNILQTFSNHTTYILGEDTMVAKTNANPEIGSCIDVAGIATNYHDVGTDDNAQPPLLLLHGSGPGVSAWANWQSVIPALAEERRVIAPDIVGFGYTDRPEGFEYSRARWVDHLIAFLDELGLERVSLIGNSFGGSLGMWLAHSYPERVERLVLMGSVGVEFPLSEGLDTVWGYTPSVEAMDNVMHYFAYDRSRITDELVRLRYEASIRPGISEAFSAMFPEPRQEGIAALALADEEIRSITQPTLLVHGRDDQVIPLQTSLALHQLISASELHVFGQCGHWVQIEAGERFVELVERFLNR